MAVFALLSAGGSPGVTTAALALSLSWPGQVIIAECDPSGGDILAGLLSGHLPAAAGLLPLALEAGAGAEVPADTLWRQLVELDEEHNRLLLAGISDPRQSAALQSSLPWIAEALQGLRADVLADCGRLDALAAVRPVLSAATLAVLVLQPTLRQASRAIPRVEMLVNLMGPGRVVLLPVGDGAASSRELGQTLGVPVVGQLPHDPKTAAVLSDGLGRRRRLDERPLIRSAAAVGRGIRAAAASAGPLPGFGAPPVYAPYESGPPDLEAYAPGPDGPPPDQPGAARPAPGSAVPGRARSRPAGYGTAPSRPARDPADPARDPADPARDPVPYAASPPSPDAPDSLADRGGFADRADPGGLAYPGGSTAPGGFSGPGEYEARNGLDDRGDRRPGWGRAESGWPPLMPYDPGQPRDPVQPRDFGQPRDLGLPEHPGRAGNSGPPYQPGHSRDPGPRYDQRQSPLDGPVTSGEPPWGPRSAVPEQSPTSFGSRWPSHDGPPAFDQDTYDPGPFDPDTCDPGPFDPGPHDRDAYGLNPYEPGQREAGQHRAFGAGQYRASPPEPPDPAEPDGPRLGPAQNGRHG